MSAIDNLPVFAIVIDGLLHSAMWAAAGALAPALISVPLCSGGTQPSGTGRTRRTPTNIAERHLRLIGSPTAFC